MMTKEEYVAAYGEKCPSCEAEGVDTHGRIQADGHRAWQCCSCSTCGAEWTDEYELAGFGDLTDKDGKEIPC